MIAVLDSVLDLVVLTLELVLLPKLAQKFAWLKASSHLDAISSLIVILASQQFLLVATSTVAQMKIALLENIVKSMLNSDLGNAKKIHLSLLPVLNSALLRVSNLWVATERNIAILALLDLHAPTTRASFVLNFALPLINHMDVMERNTATTA